MKINHEAKTITLRQSWLDTLGICPERARLGIVKPEWDTLQGDEALIGTAMHNGIEMFMRGHASDVVIATHEWASTIDPETVRFNKRSSVKEIADVAALCADEWFKSIYPHVPKDGRNEVTFKVHLFDHMGYAVYLSGTPDYVTTHDIWDWKTSNREYKPWEKHRWAIQPTAYSHAAVVGALQVYEGSFPVPFRYGVVYKPRSKNGGCDSDIITVTRQQADVDWMFRKIRSVIDLALVALEQPWPLIDNENHLCSSAFCPWWSICKGAHISEDQYATPSQALPKIMPAPRRLEQGNTALQPVLGGHNHGV